MIEFLRQALALSLVVLCTFISRAVAQAAATAADTTLLTLDRIFGSSEFKERGLGEALLTPTRLYVRSCMAAIKSGGVKALAHITGVGLVDNVPRVLPEGTLARLDAATWNLPPVFRWLMR